MLLLSFSVNSGARLALCPEGGAVVRGGGVYAQTGSVTSVSTGTADWKPVRTLAVHSLCLPGGGPGGPLAGSCPSPPLHLALALPYRGIPASHRAPPVSPTACPSGAAPEHLRSM